MMPTTRFFLDKINDMGTRQAVLAERALLRGLGGGCQVPIGAITSVQGPGANLERCVVLDLRIGRERIACRGNYLAPNGSGNHRDSCWRRICSPERPPDSGGSYMIMYRCQCGQTFASGRVN